MRGSISACCNMNLVLVAWYAALLTISQSIYTDEELEACAPEVTKIGNSALQWDVRPSERENKDLAELMNRPLFRDNQGSNSLVEARVASIPLGKSLLFMSRHWTVVLAAVIILMILGGVTAFDMYWSVLQDRRERNSGISADADEFSKDLAQHLMRTLHVEDHQFRGMTKKQSKISISFDNLGLELNKGGKVLYGVSGKFEAGRLAAIMGPSGAGKTSFMNVLCGKATYGKIFGHVYINGQAGHIQDFKPVMGFVPQDDVVHEKLTVREQIRFSAYLRNPAGTDESTIRNIVEDVLAVMQLQNIQGSVVGSVEARGISGGQRKRVNIGIELAACPTILFCDEPTSGLDSTSSLAIIKSLKTMTHLGMTIVMVIHQPRYSLFTLFNDVLLLGKGGRTVYLGPSRGAKPYFESLGFEMPENENPADWFMDVISGSVSNLKDESFKPHMLFDSWTQNRFKEGLGITSEPINYEEREWTREDDRAVLMQSLEDEWKKMHLGISGILNAHELGVFLQRCTRKKPEKAVVEDLLNRMGGENTKTITKQQLVDYLVDLQDIVAHDLKHCAGGQGFSRRFTRSPSPRSSATEPLEDVQRILPGWLTQCQILIHRRLVQIRWDRSQRLLDNALIVTCALLLGTLHQSSLSFENAKSAADLAGRTITIHLCLTLLISISSLKVFSAERTVYWRESSSGLNTFSYFVAGIATDTLDFILQCVLFSALYYLIAQPGVDFSIYFVPCLFVGAAASGIGYAVSVFLPPHSAALGIIVIVLTSCGFFGHPGNFAEYTDGGLRELVLSTSITRWSAQWTYLQFAETAPNLLGRAARELEAAALKSSLAPSDALAPCSLVHTWMVIEAYKSGLVNRWFGLQHGPFAMLVVMAIVLRVLALVGLYTMNRSKRV